MMHLAITFCRANIPARYATGYLGDIDADPDPTPMDFAPRSTRSTSAAAGGRWTRHGKARIGRVLMGRGRDAADVAAITSFGRHRLRKFHVVTDEIATTPAQQAPTLPLAMSA